MSEKQPFYSLKFKREIGVAEQDMIAAEYRRVIQGSPGERHPLSLKPVKAPTATEKITGFKLFIRALRGFK